MITEILQEALKKQKLVGVYANHEDTSKFTVGYVDKIFEEGILLSVISPDVKSDGFALINMNLIYLIEYDNLYLKNIEKTIDNHNIKIQCLNFRRNENLLLIIDFLNFCKLKNTSVTIKHNYGFEILGYVVDIENIH